MILAAFMVTGFLVASVYAVAMLRGRTDRYHRLGMLIPLVLGSVVAPIQIVVGDWAARSVGADQPVKLAAMEGLYRSGNGAPESLGGYYSGNSLHGAIRIPDGLSLLLHLKPHSYVMGLDKVPPALQPPVTVVHWSFDLMVAIGFGLLALGAWLGVTWWTRRTTPRSVWFLRATAVSGVAAVVAMEAGWIVTEVGRQPWIVYNVLKVSSAVNRAPGLSWGLAAVLAVYAVLTVALVYVLRRMTRSTPVPDAPQERDVTEYKVV
jgi:cytochrome d ubiquinol oxidase subunit I